MSFEAKYGGYCRSCDGTIHVGDQAMYVDSQLVHLDCCEASQDERPVAVCGKCWLTKPCDCEDDQ